MTIALQTATFVLVLVTVATSASLDHPKKHSITKTSIQKSKVECPIVPSIDKDDLIPNSEDCTTYYHCVYGTPVLMPCPAGLHFNPEMQYCDWPWEAGCDHSFDPKPSPSKPTLKPNTCRARV